MCAKRDKKPGFDSEFDGITLKIKLRGEIDHHTAAVVRVNIDELIRSRVPRILSLDMSAVDFMDSSGLGLIMGRYSLMQSTGGEMYVLDPSPATEKIMNLAGMERMVKIKRSRVANITSEKQNMNAGREQKKRAARHRTSERETIMSKRDISHQNSVESDQRRDEK